jgi:CheY-like chemotaxis protein
MSSSQDPNPPPLNILLVEDDEGDAKAIQRAFRKKTNANPILRAVDGLEALEILQGSNGAKAPSPRIMLVDLNMPRMDGLQFIRAIRGDRNLRHSIVFILTTSKREEDKLAAYDLNVAGYIIKATAGEDLSNLVNLIDSYWRIVDLP